MKPSNAQDGHVLEEQLAYARVLDVLIKIGFAGLLASFVLYVARVLPPYVEMETLATLWHLPLDEDLARTGTPSAPWEWTRFLEFGDIVNYVPVAFIGSVSFICLARVLPVFAKKGDVAYTVIVLVQLVVIALAASGVLVAGTH
jgi:hypothetical protein